MEVVTGLEEEKYECNWKILNLAILQKDEVLIEKEKFEIITGENTQLQSKWVLGLKNNPNEKTYTVYCKLLQIFSALDIEELITNFTIKLLDYNGTPCWTKSEQKRVKVSDGFDLGKLGYIYNKDSSWKGYQDASGAVTFYVSLGLLKPFISEFLMSKNIDAIEKQFEMQSEKMAQRNLAFFMNLDSTEYDVKILCNDGKKIRCHKAILEANSPVFSTMLQTDLSEVNTGIIEVKDFSSKTAELLVQYLYTGKLQKSWRDTDTIVEFTYAAGKYQLGELVEHLNNMIGNTNEDPTTLMTLLGLTSKMSMKKAEAQLMNRIRQFTISAKSSDEMLCLFGARN